MKIGLESLEVSCALAWSSAKVFFQFRCIHWHFYQQNWRFPADQLRLDDTALLIWWGWNYMWSYSSLPGFNKDVVHLFKCSLAIFSQFSEMTIYIFYTFFLLISKSYLCILLTSPLSVICMLKMPFPFILLTLLWWELLISLWLTSLTFSFMT